MFERNNTAIKKTKNKTYRHTHTHTHTHKQTHIMPKGIRLHDL